MKQGNLGLSIRTPESFKLTQVAKITPRNVAKWLDELPIANFSESSKRLYQMLLECNKSDLGDDDRYKIMVQLHSPVQTILQSLSKHFTGHTLNLTDKQRKIAALVQAIHTEMSIGFKIIIENQAESPSLLKKNLVHNSLFLAIEYLSLTILRCYQIYTNVPDRLWSEVNCIYKYSLENKLQQKPEHFEGFTQDRNIEDVFIKTCLLSIANPYQLRQQEIQTVYNGLHHYIDYCGLEPSNRFDNRYAIDLHLSTPPQHQALARVRPSKFSFAFNLEQVVIELQSALKEQRTKLHEEVSIGGISVRLIRHLLKNWAHTSSRHFARTPCESQIKICIGLMATHKILAGGDEPVTAFVETLDHLEGSLQNASIVDDSSTTFLHSFGNEGIMPKQSDEDIWAKMYRPKQAIPETANTHYINSFNKEPNKLPEHEKITLSDADIVNISPGGYCIELKNALPQQTQTGEVIGLVEEDNSDNPSWHIGVIRWIRRSKGSGGIQVGVQLIAPGARPIHSQLRSRAGKRTQYQNALLLPELKGIGQPATILTNPVLYNPKQRILIIDGEDAFEAKLTKLVSSSQGYRQFYFERVEVPLDQDQSSSTDLGSSDDNFDNVWDLI